MKHYIDVDKLKVLLSDLEENHKYYNGDFHDGVVFTVDKAKELIDSLQQEQPVDELEKELEEAAERYNEMMSWEWEAPNYPHKAAFIAGAEWQKAKMLEEAEECDLYYDGDFLAIDLNMVELGYSEKDKIKVIVIKEEQK